MNWLETHLQSCRLTPEIEGYCLGRGAREESIASLGLKTWSSPLQDFEDPEFVKRYGFRGERLQDWLVWPLLSPRNRTIGFAGRRIDEKVITRYLLPEAAWNPVWTGLTLQVMERIWAGADVWVVEGIFDLFPMEWAIPETDVVLGSERARLSDKHIEFLRRFCTGWVRMVYDNDETGRRGTHGYVDETGKKRWGAIQRLERVGVKGIDIPYRGKDPGYIWNQRGAAGIRQAFAQ